MPEKYDIAVIGAGIGGLTAGALLARKGLKVGVFESHKKPGGYCTGFKRGPYRFDAALDAISGCGENGWVTHVLKKLSIEDRVCLVRLDPLRVDLFGDDRLEIPGSMEALMDLLYGIAWEARENTLALLETREEIYRAAMSTPPETLFTDGRIIKRGGALGKFYKASYRDLLDAFVKNERLRAVMCDRCAFMGLPPSKVSAISMTMMFMTYALGGGYRIKGGAQTLADVFAAALAEQGGELHLKTPVEGITVKDGGVTGIVTGEGPVEARCVLSAMDASSTAKLAGLEPPADMNPSVSFFMVYLGLNRLLDIPDSMGVYPGYDIEPTFGDIGINVASKRSSVEIINYSSISPDMAPDGGMSVMLMAKAAYDYAQNWKECKQREAEHLIEKADKAIPGLKAAIDVIETATPLTLERYTKNLHGAAFGWEQVVGNQHTPVEWPVQGLIHAGHWTYPGGGIESVVASGIVAVEKAASCL